MESPSDQSGSLSLARITIAANDAARTAAFYKACFEADIEPVAAFGTTLYRGWLGGIEWLVCPNEIAGVVAESARHQLRFRVASVEATIARARAVGGDVEGEAIQNGDVLEAIVRDPDGNPLEIFERR